MATEKRLIEIIECLRNCANNTDCERCSRWLYPCNEKCVDNLMASAAEELEKFVNGVEVVHGRWNEKQAQITWCEDDVDTYWMCSVFSLCLMKTRWKWFGVRIASSTKKMRKR